MKTKIVLTLLFLSMNATFSQAQMTDARMGEFLKNSVWQFGLGTISFGKNGKASGFSGCNRFGGNYAITGKYLRIRNLVSTRKACPRRQMVLERLFLSRLEKVRWFKGTSRTMLMFDSDSEIVLRLKAKAVK